MTDSLAVAVNRDGLHTLTAPSKFEASGSFTVELHNHGEAAHVHINLDDRLSEVARIGATNHYVEGGKRRLVDIETRDPSVWPSESVRGKLKIVAGHGQETHYVDIIFDRSESDKQVRVDPDLSTPKSDYGFDTPPLFRLLPVVVLGSVAILLAVGALFAAQNTLVIGLLAILAAVLCAVTAYVLLR